MPDSSLRACVPDLFHSLRFASLSLGFAVLPAPLHCRLLSLSCAHAGAAGVRGRVRGPDLQDHQQETGHGACSNGALCSAGCVRREGVDQGALAAPCCHSLASFCDCFRCSLGSDQFCTESANPSVWLFVPTGRPARTSTARTRTPRPLAPRPSPTLRPPPSQRAPRYTSFCSRRSVVHQLWQSCLRLSQLRWIGASLLFGPRFAGFVHCMSSATFANPLTFPCVVG